MADLSYHHGTRVFDNNNTPVQIRTAQSAVIFLMGTAPDADPTVFPLNQPVLIEGGANYTIAESLGNAGTLKKAVDAILQQGDRLQLGAYIYINRIAAAPTLPEMISNGVGDPDAMTGIYAALRIEKRYGRKLKPRIFIAPGLTHALAADGVNAVNVTNGGSGYGPKTTMTATGGGLRNCVLSPIIVDGVITGAAIVRPGFGATTPGDVVVTISDPDGGGSGAQATASIGSVGNPIAHELEGLLPKFRAIAFIDGPNTTDAAAVATTEQYGSDRLYVVDPFSEVWDATLNAYVPVPSSSRFAGVQVRVDREVGFFKSVSNELIYGIDGAARPITYGAQTDYLNQGYVGTIVNLGEGFRTWGNRCTDGTFLSVRRARDFVNEAIETAYLKYVDKPESDAWIKLMLEDARAFLKDLEGNGAVLRDSSSVWLDPAKNTAQAMQQGRIRVSVKYEVPPPMEDISIDSYYNVQAYTLLLDRVNGAIEAGALAA